MEHLVLFFDVLIYPRDLVLTEYDWSIQSHPLNCSGIFAIFLCHSEQVMWSLETNMVLLLRYPAVIWEYCSRMRFCAKRMGQDHRTSLQTSKCNHLHSQTNSMNYWYFIILHLNQCWQTHWKHLACFHLFEVLLVQRNHILPFLSETSSSLDISGQSTPKFQSFSSPCWEDCG